MIPPEKKSERPSWHAKLKVSLLSEAMKNWAAVMMGVAALVTALGTYKAPASDVVLLKGGYETLRQEVQSLSKDVAILNSNINYLYRVRELEEHKRRVAAELQRTNDILENSYLEKYLTIKYGAGYAKSYMLRREKLREEIQNEARINDDFKPDVIAPKHALPLLEELKNKN
jgi:hypothetical protein